jgi:hypothetical protein
MPSILRFVNGSFVFDNIEGRIIRFDGSGGRGALEATVDEMIRSSEGHNVRRFLTVLLTASAAGMAIARHLT